MSKRKNQINQELEKTKELTKSVVNEEQKIGNYEIEVFRDKYANIYVPIKSCGLELGTFQVQGIGDDTLSAIENLKKEYELFKKDVVGYIKTHPDQFDGENGNSIDDIDSSSNTYIKITSVNYPTTKDGWVLRSISQNKTKKMKQTTLTKEIFDNGLFAEYLNVWSAL